MKLANLVRWLLFGGEFASLGEPASLPAPPVRPVVYADNSDKDGYLQYQENGLQIFVDLPEGKTSFGRSNSMDCTLEDPHISGKHAIFERSGENYYVTDTGSDGGTYVDGKKIPQNKAWEIFPGNVISLANVVPITFRRRPSARRSKALVVSAGGKQK